MKDTTFGNSTAAKTLATLLTELNEPKVTRSVTRFLISQTETAKLFRQFYDPQLTPLYRTFHICIIRDAKLVGVTGKIESYMKNLAVAKFRQKP